MLKLTSVYVDVFKQGQNGKFVRYRHDDDDAVSFFFRNKSLFVLDWFRLSYANHQKYEQTEIIQELT